MSSRPPKMSSQTDLGGRPHKFGRTMAALVLMVFLISQISGFFSNISVTEFFSHVIINGLYSTSEKH